MEKFTQKLNYPIKFCLLLLSIIFSGNASAQYDLIFLEEFNTVPQTDLALDGYCSNPDGPGGNPGDGGTYVLTDAANSPLNGGWNNPTGNLDSGVSPSAGVAAPSGNFFVINAFGATGWQCQNVTDDLNANSVGGEMACFDLSSVSPGDYILTSFFAELTNTDPHISSYSFFIKNSSNDNIIASVAANNLTQNNQDWQYNSGSFTLNSTTNLRLCLLQTQNEDLGADIAIDNLALYRLVDTDGDGIADLSDLDDDNDGVLDEYEACGSLGGGTTSVGIEIQLDGFPGEVSWTLQTSGGSNIGSGSGYSTNNLFVSEVFNVAAGDYSFTINDTYGDGLTATGGYYQIRVDGSIIIGPVSTNYSSNTHNFTIASNSFSCVGGDPSDDDDNDGILNYKDADFCSLNATGVCSSLDTDGDGIIDQLDLDSDGDGCYDAEEAGHGESMESDHTIVASSADVGTNGVDAAVETDDTGAADHNYSLEETNSGTVDYQSNAVAACIAQFCEGTELVVNGDFENAYANWTSDLNRGRNNFGPTSGGCGGQGWVAVSSCASTNGACNDYYEYNGSTPTGTLPITDPYGSGANVIPTTNCNSSSSSCLAESLADHTSGSGFSIYIDPNDISGISFWRQSVNIEANTTYKFSAWVMVIENTPNIEFRIDGNSLTGGLTLTRQTGGSNGTDSWQEIAVTWNSGSNSGTVAIELVNLVSSCSGNDFRIDDISLKSVYVCDADGDGIVDADDLDDDNDGIPDADECVTTLSSTPTPDGVQDGHFPYGYWDAEYFDGHFGITGSTYGNSATDGDGTGGNGTPTFLGEAYLGVNTLSFVDSRSFTQNQTPTSAAVAPANYVGTNYDGNGNPYYQILFNRKMDTNGTLTFGGSGHFDDIVEVFVNGSREVFAGGCCGASSNPSSTTYNIPYLAGDDVQFRYTNLGWVGGYEFNFTLNNDSCKDTDGDGIPDFQDLDSDNDGIPDLVEAGGVDTDGDGMIDGNIDSDGDGVPDYADPDDPSCSLGDANAPTDGICDNVQGVTDTDGDGIQDSDDYDADGNGIPDVYDSANGGDDIANADSDGDGIPDAVDLDSDNDGIPDIIEAGGIDTDGDGRVDALVDSDGDGFDDAVDGDVGNDGTENTANALIVTGTDTDADGVPNTYPNGDTDGDGILDKNDLDADGDGLTDLVEAGGVDTNGDGTTDTTTDADGDGFADVYDPDDDGTPGIDSGEDTNPLVETDGSGNFLNGETGNSLDQDGDGHPDHLDLDADGDGLTDLVEAGGVDTNGDGLVDTTTDADNDGLADIYDTDDDGTPGIEDTNDALLQTGGTDTDADGKADDSAITFTDGDGNSSDQDGDGNPDHLDLDADGDGLTDLVEAGGIDTNGDGLVDATTDADNDGLADIYDTDDDGTPGVEDANDALLQTGGTDTDADGKADDSAITFADGDGNPSDQDGDGNPDHLDLDADNDGIPDLVEAGGIDTDGNGLVDTTTDADNDGLADIYDTDDDGTAGVEDANDALLQTGGTDTDADGKADDSTITYADGNGNPSDQDGDGNPDHLDLDADNDGIPDLVEVGGIDTDGDGQVDSSTDVDQDGLADIYDEDATDGPGGDGTNGTALVETNGSGTMVAGDDGTEFLDTDGDSIPDHLDLDADNDGIPDLIEAGGHDPEGDGMVDTTSGWDTDGDGLADNYDTNDNASAGTADGPGSALLQTNADTNGDGTVDAASEMMVSGGGGNLPINPDGDAVPNHLDIDADNDGIMDVTEAGATDSNNDGMVDNGSGSFIDSDNDGLADAVDGDVGNDGSFESSNPLITTNTDDAGDADDRLEYAGNGLSDSDADDVPDFLDVDSDNDGIYDNYEGQSTAGYIPPGSTDTDGDGLLDAYDADEVGVSTNGISPYNHDNGQSGGDSVPDYLDLDADADNIPDMQEAWDDIADGDSQCDNVASCSNTDADGDGLIDCFDANDADPSSYGWAANPADDTDGANGAAAGTVFADDLDDLLPDNIGNNAAEPDYRDNISACATAEVYYGITESSAGTSTNFEFNSNNSKHEDGAGTQVIRATVYCEPDADGWYYYYNPLEPENYLFAIKNSSGSPNTVEMWDIVDYIEIKVESVSTNRHQIGSTTATLVMDRDWHVVFKGTPTLGSTFDIKYYYDPAEMSVLAAAADAVEAQAIGSVVRSFQWFKKPGGLSNGDISSSGVTDLTDISANDPNGIDENSTDQLDGTAGSTTGNGRNYVQFNGLSSFSGGSAVISMAYSALPVELVAFDAKAKDCEVQLYWSTSSQTNFSHFELEWSSDGRSFTSIDEIKGATESNAIQYYQTMDKSQHTENYYRLKMVDIDGSYEHSEVVFISTDCALNDLNIYPNPVEKIAGILQIEFTANRAESTIVINDLLGRVVKRLVVDTDVALMNVIQLPIQDFPIGTYLLSIDDKRNVKRFIIQE